MTGSFRDSSCTRKVRFPSKHQAKQEIKRLARENGRPMGLGVYGCVFCAGGFHIGHKRQELELHDEWTAAVWG